MANSYIQENNQISAVFKEVGMTQQTLLYVAPVAGLISLVFAAIMMVSVLRESQGNDRMKEISQDIYAVSYTHLTLPTKRIV